MRLSGYFRSRLSQRIVARPRRQILVGLQLQLLNWHEESYLCGEQLLSPKLPIGIFTVLLSVQEILLHIRRSSSARRQLGNTTILGEGIHYCEEGLCDILHIHLIALHP